MNKIESSFVFLLIVALAGCASSAKRESAGEYVDSAVITARVKSRLFDEASLASLAVEVDTYKDRVQLSGFVDAAEQKQLAGKVASRVPDVKVVHNDLIVKPSAKSAGEYVDDSVVTTKVKTALLGAKETRTAAIEVSTYKGVVQLSGFVNTAEQRNRATQRVQRVNGVKSVRNDLIVK